MAAGPPPEPLSPLPWWVWLLLVPLIICCIGALIQVYWIK